jgi:hypothetical protein
MRHTIALVVLFFILTTTYLGLTMWIHAIDSSAQEPIISVQDVLFAFGWSGAIGETWRVNGVNFVLNNRGLLIPPSIPLNSDGGTTQTSAYLIDLNNIGFSFGWSINTEDRYCSSNTIQKGSPISLNPNALKPPTNWAIGTDNTPPVTLNDYDTLWHNESLIIILTAEDNESGVAETYYRINEGPTLNVTSDGQPVITSEGDHNTLEYWSVDNYNNEELPHNLLPIRIDKTNPTIWTQTRRPNANVTAYQLVKVSVNATDSLSGIKSVRIRYNANDSALWLDFPMDFNSTTGLYEYSIPEQQAGTLVRYEITAYDNAWNSQTDDNGGQYFAYVTIPEFSSILIWALLMIATVPAVLIYRKWYVPRPRKQTDLCADLAAR